MGGPDHRDDIQAELRNYLRSHPGAGDTATGIVSFWLCLPPTERNLRVTIRALEHLEQEGLLRRRQLAATAYWYVPDNR